VPLLFQRCSSVRIRGLAASVRRQTVWTKRRQSANMNAMPHSDYDVSSLARYLHLSPQQVTKLAERGKLPGRKVAGRWRFARPDIHHWFENRIGLSGESELREVENVLKQSAATENEHEIRIADMLPVEAIAVPLAARTRNSVIDAMVELAAQTGWLWDTAEMAAAVKAREDIHPTALENGVALLHPRRPLVKILAQPFLALGCTTTGIPFGGAAPMSDVFFLICSTDDRGHLRTLARLSRVLASPGFLNALHQVGDAAEAHALIVATDESLEKRKADS
jgi:nitrogen PTS system EIIA component